MRVALISPEYPPTLPMGGIGTHALTLSRALRARGHDVLVVTWGTPSKSVEDGVEVVRLKHRWVPNRALERLMALRDLAKAATRWRADVIVAAEWDALGWWAARLSRVPVVTRLATPTFMLDRLNTGRERRSSSFVRTLERDQTRHSALVYGPTTSIVEIVSREWRLPEGKVRVVPNSMDLDAVLRSAAHEPPLSIPPRSIVFIGRLEPRKGVGVLGEAMPRVLAAHPDAHAFFIGRDAGVGDGAFMDAFRRCVEPVADRVHVLGELPRDVALSIVARAAVVVLPSLWENFAHACLEAMILGRPVIASAVGGFPEMITDGRDGWLVPAGDARALADSMVEHLGNDEELRRVGDAARKRAAAFESTSVAERVDAILSEAAGPVAGFDQSVYRRDYRRHFRPDDPANPFAGIYEEKRGSVLGWFEGRPPMRVLDVGGGFGRIALPLAERHRVTMCDLSIEMLEEAKVASPDRICLVAADARRLPFASGSFDAALAIDLLPHLPDLEAGLRELARVIAPSGRLVFDTSNASPWWVIAYPAYVSWRPRRLIRTMLGRGVLPEWRRTVRHHRAGEVKAAVWKADLRIEETKEFGPRWTPKWHLWVAARR